MGTKEIWLTTLDEYRVNTIEYKISKIGNDIALRIVADNRNKKRLGPKGSNVLI
jgi:hypothetical protein